MSAEYFLLNGEIDILEDVRTLAARAEALHGSEHPEKEKHCAQYDDTGYHLSFVKTFVR